MANAAQQLQEAYQFIETGNLQEARQLLEEIRPQNENNPDFWWVYAHALEDENEGRNALNRVRQLAPNYPGLQDVEEQAGIRLAQPPLQPLRKLSQPSTDDVFDDLDDLDSEFDDLDSEEEEKSGGGLRNVLIGVGGFVVLLVIIFLILSVSGMLGGGTPSPTEVVDQNTPEFADTDVPTDEVVAVTDEPSEEATTDTPTEEPSETPEATEIIDPFAALYADLAGYGVPDDGISYEATALGNSLVVDTCANPGPTANANIIGVMDVFAAASLELSEDVEAITFNITNCETNTVSLVLGLGRDAFMAYLGGTSSPSELLQAIQRVA